MRTTIDLERALLERLRREALRRRIPFKTLLNKLLREGLAARPVAPSAFHGPVFAMGNPEPALDLTKALGLAAALEDDEVVRELQRRK